METIKTEYGADAAGPSTSTFPKVNGSQAAHQSSAADSTHLSSTVAENKPTNGLLLPEVVPVADAQFSEPVAVSKGLAGRDRTQIGVFAREPISQGRYICEYKGHVLLKAAYKEDPKNYYDLLRITRPYSHFHPEIDLCVDARRQGSEVRFIRRGCNANAVLKSFYLPESSDSLIHLGLFATRDVQADEELTIGWEWEDKEMPAVSRMTSTDAEDYLGRPEGRRMSKVWRQAFGGMSCACMDADCEVRRLFAMLGVDESVVRPDISGTGTVKRRASRSAKLGSGSGSGNADAGDRSSSSPQVQSPDGSKSVRSSHSRKGSMASLAEAAPGSPTSALDSAVGSRDGLSVFTGRRVSHESFSRKGNADLVSAGSDDRSIARSKGNGNGNNDCDDDDDDSDDGGNDDDEDGEEEDVEHFGKSHDSVSNEDRGDGDASDGNDYAHQGASGSRSGTVPMARKSSSLSSSNGANGDSAAYSRNQSRKRKPSAHIDSKQLGKSVLSAYSGSVAGKENSKKARSRTGSPVQKMSMQQVLPLKKLWMSQYLEYAESVASASADDNSPTAEPKPKAVVKDLQVNPDAQKDDVRMKEPDENNTRDMKDSANEVEANVSIRERAVAVPEHGPIKSVPMDADAPTPEPTDPATAFGDASTEPGAASGLASDSKIQGDANDITAPADSDSVSVSVPDNQHGSKAEASANGADVVAAAAADEKPSVFASAVPAKKQRLSLEDYKRRRVNNVSTPTREADAKDNVSETGPEKLAEPVDTSETSVSAEKDVSKDQASMGQLPASRTKVTLAEYNRRRKASGSFAIDGEPGSASGGKESQPVDKSILKVDSTASRVVPEADNAAVLNGQSAVPPLSPRAALSQEEASNSAAESVLGPLAIPSRLVRSPAQPISAPFPMKPGAQSARSSVVSPPPPPPPPLPPLPSASLTFSPAASVLGGRPDDRGAGPTGQPL
ncbi:SET domain-containing protein 3, partial [Coemansia asiatica]